MKFTRIPSRRRPLIKGRTAIYHVISRTVRDEFLFGAREKEVFREMIWKLAEFHGMEILTYCVMSNHFHLLIRVPYEEELSDEVLLKRYRRRYSNAKRPFSAPAPDVLQAILSRNDDATERWRKLLTARMGNLPVFMRELKQAFCIWFNNAHQNHGTIWAERYKSLIVQDDPAALKIVAAYIDLNPVRAKLADDPAEYRWCGYAESLSGSQRAREGICGIAPATQRNWKSAIAIYRVILFGKGRKAKGDLSKDRGRISPETADAALGQEGNIGLSEALRRRVRYFTEGMVVGSESFLEEYFRSNRSQFGPRRKSGSRKMQGTEWGDLRSMRHLSDAVE